MKKLVLTFTISCFVAFTSYAQMSFGGGLSHNYVFAGLTNIGIDLRGEWAPDEDYSTFTGNVSFFLPSKIEGTTYANAFSSTTSPSQIEVADEFKVSMIHLAVGYKRYFKGEMDDDFNFYGALSVGLLVAPTTYKITGEYDSDKYGVSVTNYDPSIPGSKETLGNFTMGGAIGIEKELQRDFYFTAETGLVLPATGYNSRTGATSEYDIGGAWRSTLGIRFNI